jgi:PAS domain S-box-containing protein
VDARREPRVTPRAASMPPDAAPQLCGLPAIERLRHLQRGSPFIVVEVSSGKQDPRVPKRANGNSGRPAAEHRIEQMIASAMAGIWFSAPEGKTSFMNQRMAQILGLSADEAARARVTDFVAPGDRADVAERLVQRMAGVSASYEHGFLRKDRSEGWGSFESTPLFDAEGGFEGVLTVMTDITEQKRAARANLALEEQLRRSQKMDAVGRLAGGVAHDFNNLLAVVLSYSELILSNMNVDHPLHADIEEIRQAALRAADLTRQLLVFSRSQAVEAKVVMLDDVLSGMEKMLQQVVGENVALTAVCGATIGRVRGDRGSLEQVVMNLVVNARDAMPSGGKLCMETADVVLDVEYASTHLGAVAGSYVMLSVSDTGTGMDAATLARIFEPFFTTKAFGKGTGLGLATVFGIVKQSGGSIGVYSEPGLGTTVKIYLPSVEPVANAPRIEAPVTNVQSVLA